MLNVMQQVGGVYKEMQQKLLDLRSVYYKML